MNRAVVALLLAVIAFPVVTTAEERPAAAPVAAASPEAARQEAALAMIQFAWQKLNYEIVFLPARRGYRALTIPSKRRIEVYARPNDDIRLIAYDIAHELGHAIDVTYNTSETRRKWLELRKLDPSTEWFGCSRCSDYNTPAGDFAETFALILMGPDFFRGRIAPAPATTDLQQIISFFPPEYLPARK
jgi:hypothetical protein